MRIYRQRLHINGIVQGVGFRPFIYRIAKQCHLCGFVQNNSNGVCIEIEGSAEAIESFNRKLFTDTPPFANIISIRKEDIAVCSDSCFEIIKTDSNEKAHTLISPDISLCQDCLNELFDPENRRFHYPFINCTNCGPRYTIIQTIPYDRSFTSMAEFEMCPQCMDEYNNPLNRRFHAQPNACPQCGPQLHLSDRQGITVTKTNLIAEAAQLIKDGFILALRGLGGFHLAVDPFNSKSLAELRKRKGRQDKPFALMARNISSIADYCHISKLEKECLLQPTRPIVILRAIRNNKISDRVAPVNNYLGFMLPYTPLHHLLMEHFDILVMTSANFTDEPIAISNDESLQRLKNIADYFLSHNREILQRCDDSIVRVMDHKQRMIRRSRGYIPAPVFISKDTKKNMLAVGGELKNTIALSRKNEVFFSQHIGDLDNPAAYRFFENSIAHLKDILQIKPDIIVCDMHPEYLSSKWAKQQNLPLFEVQHHHAHLASVLAEKHIDEPAIGIILDGTGYGPDGTIWGGEVLVGDAAKFERYAWFDLLAMPGGKAAIKEPWRMAYSYLKKSFAEDVAYLDLPVLKNIKEQDKLILDQMLEKNLNAPLTSSCGRLFDAVSAILGVCRDVTFEAQAAIELEMHVDDRISSYYDQVISGFDTFSENIILTELIKCVVNDYLNGSSVSKIAAKFHNTLAQLIVRIAMEVRSTTRLNKVALSGGVFQNMFLFDRVIKELKEKNFEVITHTLVPANDGGLALGQIAVANTKL